MHVVRELLHVRPIIMEAHTTGISDSIIRSRLPRVWHGMLVACDSAVGIAQRINFFNFAVGAWTRENREIKSTAKISTYTVHTCVPVYMCECVYACVCLRMYTVCAVYYNHSRTFLRRTQV